MNERVEIPVYCDRWAMGDRCGDVIKVVKTRVRRPPPGHGGECVEVEDTDEIIEIAHVKLDISGKTVRVVYADCKVL